MRNRYAILAGLLLFTTSALAQMQPHPDRLLTRAGMFWHYNVNKQRVAFASLPGVPGCCQEYEEAIGTGFTLGALLEFQFDYHWSLQLRGSYGTHDATITDTEKMFISDNGTPLPAEIEHAIDAELSTVDFDGIIGYRIFSGLTAKAGFRVGLYTKTEYYQNESLVQPLRRGTFENGLRVRNEYSGELLSVKNVLGSVIMGLSYDLPLNEQASAFLVPEIQYLLNITPVVQNLDWYADGIHIGMALKFDVAGRRESQLPDKPGRDEYEGWKERQMQQQSAEPPQRTEQQRTEPQPNTLRLVPDPTVPMKGVKENPQPTGDAPPVEKYGRHYEDDVDETGQPVVTPPEQQPEKKEATGDLRRQDLEPVPTDADIAPAPKTRTIEKIQTATPVPATTLDDLEVTAFGLDPYGDEIEFTSIAAEEFGMTDVVTLLNYVFFSESSSQIPSRYTLLKPDEAESFRIGNLDAGDKMRQHYNVLNIIGSRLKEYPEAGVTIVGCNSGAGPEQGRLDLSRSRAESVRDYLTDIWGVNSQRMTLVSRALPENPTIGEVDADEENRRVEIYSDTWEILRPIVWSGTEWRPEPPSVRFTIPAIDADEIDRWRFSVQQDNDVLKEYSGGSAMPETLDWNIAREQPFRSGLEVPVEYVLRVIHANGTAYKSESRRIPLELTSVQEKRIAGLPDKEFTRYHLIVFEEENTTPEDYKKKVTEMVTSIFGSEAVITVVGMNGEPHGGSYADSALRIASQPMPINGSLPEGRFYNRAIRVLVEAPAER